jgi:hypothetical protein
MQISEEETIYVMKYLRGHLEKTILLRILTNDKQDKVNISNIMSMIDSKSRNL